MPEAPDDRAASVAATLRRQARAGRRRARIAHVTADRSRREPRQPHQQPRRRQRRASRDQETRRAARRRPGARRAARRSVTGGSRRRAPRPTRRAAAGRVDVAAAHPGHQRRRHRVARPAGARSRRSSRSATSTCVAPETNQSAVGHQKTFMRPLRVRERTLADGSHRLVGRRLADRRREPGLPGLLRHRLRPRRLGHQLRRQPGRRHDLLAARSARRWRRSSTSARRSRSRRSTTSIPTSRSPRAVAHLRRDQHPRERPEPEASCSTSTCRR